jgi:hypothetical protein
MERHCCNIIDKKINLAMHLILADTKIRIYSGVGYGHSKFQCRFQKSLEGYLQKFRPVYALDEIILKSLSCKNVRLGY